MEKLTDMKEVSKLARTFMKNWDSGVLSTQYTQEKGDYPFGTLCPFVIMEDGEIAILISDIAVHTKNVKNNPKVGFTVFDMTAAHKQAASRVCLIGDATKVDEKENPERYKEVSQRYINFFPMAANYFKAHNFFFYTIKPVHIHFIETFGKIYNYSGDEWNISMPKWKGSEQRAIDHMNEDHKISLVKFAKHFLDRETDQVSLMAVDGEGFHMKVDEEIHYFNFLADASDAEGLHREFVKLSKSC